MNLIPESVWSTNRLTIEKAKGLQTEAEERQRNFDAHRVGPYKAFPQLPQS
jgi:hypothetical protein